MLLWALFFNYIIFEKSLHKSAVDERGRLKLAQNYELRHLTTRPWILYSIVPLGHTFKCFVVSSMHCTNKADSMWLFLISLPASEQQVKERINGLQTVNLLFTKAHTIIPQWFNPEPWGSKHDYYIIKFYDLTSFKQQKIFSKNQRSQYWNWFWKYSVWVLQLQ